MEKKLLRLIVSFVLFANMLDAQILQDCNNSTAITTLAVNNVAATLGHSGTIWRDSYIAPTNLPTQFSQSALFAGGLWLGGVDPGGNLKLAASTYGYASGNSDYFPGPLDDTTGLVTFETCLNFDRFWEITQAEIDAFLLDFSEDDVVNDLHPAVFSWPGRGNPLSLSSNGFELPLQDLAPFIDTDGDGIYNPNNGDYPSIFGDKAIWWIFNDAGNIHSESQADPIYAEIQVMAYAFNSEIETINNATFYDFKVTNKAIEPVDSFFAGIWLDPDLGCYTDDFVGSIPDENLAFIYNADEVDGEVGCSCPQGVNTYCEEIPVFGLKLLRGPQNTQGEELGLNSFIIYDNAAIPGVPPGISDPNNALEYYNYLTGSWRDGSPITEGGDGYQEAGPATKFIFPGNPADTSEWSMCSAGSTDGDRRMVSSIGPISFNPGESFSFCYALLWIPAVEHPCPDVTPLIEAGTIAEEFCGVITTNIKEQWLSEGSVLQFPNPMRSFTRLELRNHNLQIAGFQLYDALGRKIQAETIMLDNSIEIKRGMLETGIYFYQLSTTNGKLATGKLIIQ